MEFAISLKSGEHISASSLAASNAYRASVKYFLVCPECGEPVHFRNREIPYNTPFFSHYKQIQNIKAIHACSLRVLGATFKPASSLISGIKHGQTVDRFQRDFCKELYESFGDYSPVLYTYIEKSGSQHLAKKPYMNLIRSIENFSDFSSISKFELTSDTQPMDDSLTDICLFLESNYGEWVGNFINQVANFVAVVTHPDVDESDYGRSIYKVGKESFVFIAETIRLKNPIKFQNKDRHRNERLTPQIASTLVAHLILKWRMPNMAANLIGDADSINNDENKPKIKLINKNKASYINPWLMLAQNNSKHPIETGVNNSNSSTTGGHQSKTFNKENKTPKEVINHNDTKNLIDNNIISNELPNVRSWRKSEIKPAQNYYNSKNPIKNGHVFKHVKKFLLEEKTIIYEMTIEDEYRIKDLLHHSSDLNKSKHVALKSRDAILNWSGKKNSFEAYFLAAAMSMDHEPPEFTDEYLTLKLSAWISWAKMEKLINVA
jgi:hypothetical protein